MNWLRWIRLPNLMVVALTQYILFGLFIHPLILEMGLQPRFDWLNFHGFVMVTIFLTAAGYFVNNIQDHDIDSINHPDRLTIVDIFGHSRSLTMYYAIVIIGFLLALCVAIRTSFITYLWIYPVAVGLLYMYSRHLKKRAIAGNLLVSLFCGGVAYVLYFIESNNIMAIGQIDKERYLFIRYLIFFYAGYAFITNYIRELIKDIEDIKGDQAQGGQTFPITFGLSKTHIFITTLSVVMGVLLVYWIKQSYVTISMANITFLVMTVALPILYLNMAIYRREVNYQHLSLLVKLVMLAGLINLLFYVSYL